MSRIPEEFEQNYELMEYLALNHISSFNVRTPLTSIIGYSRVLLEGLDDPISERQQAHLRSINFIAEQLLEHLNVFLSAVPFIFGQKRLYLSDIDLLQVIPQFISQMQEKTNFLIEPDLPVNLPTIKADEGQLYKGLHNILELIKQIHPTNEGKIGLSVRYVQNFVVISFLTEKGEPLRMEINPELFIVQSIAELHGGKLEIETHDDKKWILAFKLPLHPQQEGISSFPSVPSSQE